MRIKDAIYRELRYGTVLTGLVSGGNIKLDMRSSVNATRSESAYPFVVFRRVSGTEDNQVRAADERIEIEAIGLRSSANVGDDKLEQIRDALIDHFAGKHKTYGKFDANGNADPTGGLKLSARYVNTVEGFSDDLEEKVQILLFDFAYIRP